MSFGRIRNTNVPGKPQTIQLMIEGLAGSRLLLVDPGYSCLVLVELRHAGAPRTLASLIFPFFFSSSLLLIQPSWTRPIINVTSLGRRSL